MREFGQSNTEKFNLTGDYLERAIDVLDHHYLDCQEILSEIDYCKFYNSLIGHGDDKKIESVLVWVKNDVNLSTCNLMFTVNQKFIQISLNPKLLNLILYGKNTNPNNDHKHEIEKNNLMESYIM